MSGSEQETTVEGVRGEIIVLDNENVENFASRFEGFFPVAKVTSQWMEFIHLSINHDDEGYPEERDEAYVQKLENVGVIVYSFGTIRLGDILAIQAEQYAAYVEIALLWRPDVSTPLRDHKSFLRAIIRWLNVRYRQPLPEWAKTELGMEEKGKSPAPPAAIEPKEEEGEGEEEVRERGPRPMSQVRTTVVHYAYEKLRYNQDIAAERAGTTGKTYRKYHKNKWLLSDYEFKKETGKSVAQYWAEIAGS